MFTVVLLISALSILGALALVMCAEESEDDEQQQSSSNRPAKKPQKTKTSQSKIQSKVQSTVKPSASAAPRAKLLPKKAAAAPKESLVSEASEVKSAGADYYATLIKQCTVKSVSQYGPTGCAIDLECSIFPDEPASPRSQASLPVKERERNCAVASEPPPVVDNAFFASLHCSAAPIGEL
ncbi:hypothetical protein TYRP_019025 [Tyrophagus putrescentiae]|nr:hypothetical protein TYRP_019025 [Tyrophagus putrescentiae]